MIFHKHLLVNSKISKVPTTAKQGEDFLRGLVEAIDMKILQGPFSTYLDVVGNRGLTGIVLIETSHIAFHIWDETNPALLQFDLYTCGALDHRKVLEILDKEFEPVFLEFVLYDRENGFRVEDEGWVSP